ncbi:MAG: Ig-like domain-containing protein [Polyangiaceae bacterium]
MLLNVVVSSAVIALVACGSSDDSTFNGNQGDDGGLGDGNGGGLGTDTDGGGTIDGKPVASLTISPPTAALSVNVAPFPTQQFTATAKFTDGTSEAVAATWTASNAPVGTINGSGLYKTSGNQGGAVTVTATAGGKSATAALTVTLHQFSNPAGLDAATQASLLGATGAPGSVVWTYPYDAMAYPRGIAAPNMMWNGAASGDDYAIHIVSSTYELTEFTTATFPVVPVAGAAPAGGTSFAFDPAEWAAFVDSTSGPATVTVTRKSGTTYTKLVQQTWNIANRSMSGSIYYWAINKAAVVRIKPGALVPDYFLASATVPPPGEKNGANVVTTQMYCPSCHTASADGSTLLMSTGEWGGPVDVWSTLYNLKSSTTTFSGYETSSPPTELPLAGLTPDGTIAVENWAPVRGAHGQGVTDSPVDLTTASTSVTSLGTLTTTGLEAFVANGAGHHAYFPVFSADNALFAYVDGTSGVLYSLTWNPTTKKFTNQVVQAAAPASGKIAYPTISPDHRWIVYQVGPNFGSLDTSYTGDLYAVDTLNPNHPISLGGINTSASAAANAADPNRDPHRSYEPTFAPVPSGGYFWLVFHSRRTYGNELVDVPYINATEGSGTKQLWVAAIDVAGSTAGTTDPSHPPFWLPGQDPATRNMRGYWALDPCKADGATCSSGTDCCNGFCDTTNDAGAAVCGSTSSGCSNLGDKCAVSSDCCNSSTGVTCINHSCSEPPPR